MAPSENSSSPEPVPGSQAAPAARAVVPAVVDAPLTIDSSAATPVDASTVGATLSQVQWERLSQQRDVMIKAMVRVFTWLNGGVFAFTTVAWGVGIWDHTYRIVDNSTLLELIGATVVQAGIAFLAITRFLFPSGKADDNG